MIKEFNLSVLGKWCWRLKEERGSLWFRVLYAKYGEEGGTISDGGRFASSWLKNLLSIRNGMGVENLFKDNLCRELGMTQTLYFGVILGWMEGL